MDEEDEDLAEYEVYLPNHYSIINIASGYSFYSRWNSSVASQKHNVCLLDKSGLSTCERGWLIGVQN